MGLGIETNADRADPVNQAIVTAVAMLAGGGLAAALGQNATAAAGAAQNEALNNYLSAKQEKGLVDSLKSCAAGDTQCVAKWTSCYASVNTTQQQAAQNCTLDNCTAIANDARAPSINSAETLALCQGGTACENVLNSLPSQNVSAQASALSRWNSTSNAKAQDISQQAAQGSTGSSFWAQMFGQLSPVDASGAVDAMLGAAIGSLKSAGGAVTNNGETPSSSSLVCRGGTCLADNFANGSGVTQSADGTLNGVSVQSSNNGTAQTLSLPFKNGQVGVTTVGAIEAVGGKIVYDGTPYNPNHATVSGLTAKQLQDLFTPTIKNPAK